MVSSFNLVYSASAAARLLGLSFYLAKAVQVSVWASVVHVHIPGVLSRFMSKTAFRQHFAEWRKASAKALLVTRWVHDEYSYTVRNEAKGGVYQVRCHKDSINCNCEDYQNQLRFLGKGICKHGYAVLGQLGYSSLQAYLNVN